MARRVDRCPAEVSQRTHSTTWKKKRWRKAKIAVVSSSSSIISSSSSSWFNSFGNGVAVLDLRCSLSCCHSCCHFLFFSTTKDSKRPCGAWGCWSRSKSCLPKCGGKDNTSGSNTENNRKHGKHNVEHLDCLKNSNIIHPYFLIISWHIRPHFLACVITNDSNGRMSGAWWSLVHLEVWWGPFLWGLLWSGGLQLHCKYWMNGCRYIDLNR